MTFTQTIKDIFSRKPQGAIDNSEKGKVKRIFSKISGAFMLPVSVMAIAGLFLGIGAAIKSETDGIAHLSALKTFGIFVQNLGDPVFAAMPLLFMMAIIISFTDDIGSAVFAGTVAFFVFLAIQAPFIDRKADYIINADGREVDQPTGTAKILFDTGNEFISRKLFSVTGTVLGFGATLQTSIFGGIIVGAVMVWTYNKFHEVELPSAIAFFGGKRFVAFAGIILMIPLAFIFLLIWPWIGLGLAYFGEYSGTVAGLDSFVFGFVERALIPFGLHHVFYAPLWYTAAGGDAASAYTVWSDPTNANVLSASSQAEWLDFASEKTVGDSFIWISANGSFGNTISWTDKMGAAHSLPTFEFFKSELGINLGRFMQGKFSFMQFGLPAAGLAMVMAAPKENRKQAFAIIFPASLTSFVTGVTEPIEFTFLFLAPALFWGFHSLMAALSFLFMNLLGAHVGLTFSGGILDAIIYGALPVSKGTAFWWIYVIGPIMAPIYYSVFYFWVKKFDLPTPGRGGSTKLFSKSDYKNKVSSNGKVDPQALDIINAYGGADNLVKTANCATRLRFDVKDSSKVSEDKLKAAGAVGVMKSSKTHVQAIFGPKAEVIHGKVKKALVIKKSDVKSVDETLATNKNGTLKKTASKK